MYGLSVIIFAPVSGITGMTDAEAGKKIPNFKGAGNQSFAVFCVSHKINKGKQLHLPGSLNLVDFPLLSTFFERKISLALWQV